MALIPVILIVDDEPINLTVLNQILREEYQVRAANSGQAAIEMAHQAPVPDLILLDIMMPDKDGYSVITELKSNALTSEIPVIFITSMIDNIDEEMGLKMGAVDYITKPINPAILMLRIKTHLTLQKASNFLKDRNQYLEDEIERRMIENTNIQNVTIRALAHLAETRDPETGNHILRTQSYVEALARYMQQHSIIGDSISDHFINLIWRSAPLHDIGKVGLPDRILLKPGPLNEDEWNTMETHTTMGENAIILAEQDIHQPLEFLTLAKEIARSHHERWDGTGYPDGLSGEKIPFSARLMAVADVFDALTTDRVYKKAIPYDESRDIILEGRGTQFDPMLTDAFSEIYDEFVSIAKEFKE